MSWGLSLWFDYRSDGFKDNRGLRIDLMLGTVSVKEKCQSVEIDYEIRGMEKPSDHCPIIATIISAGISLFVIF